MVLGVEGLEPGLYLVGREDGTVEPFHVRVFAGKEPGSTTMKLPGPHTCDDMALLMHAVGHDQWWWRRTGVPAVLPHHVGTAEDVASGPYEWGEA